MNPGTSPMTASVSECAVLQRSTATQETVSSPTLQEAVITGLLPETTYSITVAAYTTKGDGARSKARTVTTTGAGLSTTSLDTLESELRGWSASSNRNRVRTRASSAQPAVGGCWPKGGHGVTGGGFSQLMHKLVLSQLKLSGDQSAGGRNATSEALASRRLIVMVI